MTYRDYIGAAIAGGVVVLMASAPVWAQTPSQTPKVDNRGPGTAASDVAPGAPTRGVAKEGRKGQTPGGKAVNEGASAAQTYDYPASAPKSAPARRP